MNDIAITSEAKTTKIKHDKQKGYRYGTCQLTPTHIPWQSDVFGEGGYIKKPKAT